ncbi:MAG: tail fiber domain-containing protein [Pyrinomonadaceae bacterium]
MKNVVSSVLLIIILTVAVNAQTTEFAFQGSLKDNAAAANGSYDFEFALFDMLSAGTQIGATVPKNNVPVTNGIFSVKLDFGSVFPGAHRYLEVRVRLTGQPGMTLLLPRQLVGATPYSITAGDATSPNIARLTVPNTAMTASGAPAITNGFITSAAVTNGGSGYQAPPVVGISDTIGSGAVITANISGDVVTSLTVQNPGSNYSVGTTLTIASPPSNAFQTFVTPNFFTGINSMNNVNNTFTGSFTGNGAGLTTLNAANLASGTVADARLSSNVALRGSNNDFFGQNIFFGRVGIGNIIPSYPLHIVNSSNLGLRVQTNIGGGTVASFGGNGEFQVDSVGVVGGRFIVKENGRVGIGTASPTNTLHVIGGITASSGIAVGGTISTPGHTHIGTLQIDSLFAGGSTLCRNATGSISNCSSSLRYKTDIEPFTPGIELINRLRPVSYTWKVDQYRDLGLIAEEVEKIEPLLTFRNKQGQIEGVKYEKLAGLFINAFKEQHSKIEEQTKQLEQQQKQIDALKALICPQNIDAEICRSNK